jgi:prepilin-type N-terminal cleavage/methylation domain-containing protein
MERSPSTLRGSRRESGFTLVELIAAVALLLILAGILVVVFGEASKTVSIAQTRLARYAAVRAFFRLLEDDLANAFFMNEDWNWYGLTGESAQDPAFLTPAPNGASDRLKLIRLRSSQSVAADKPGFVQVCYLRRTYPKDRELVADRRNVLFRVADEDMKGWTPSPPAHLFPTGFLLFTAPDPTNSANDEYFRRYIVALDVSDLQFRYQPQGSPAWQETWDPDKWSPPGWIWGDIPGLPVAVEVTIRLGPDWSTDPVDHETFTQVIRLPSAP